VHVVRHTVLRTLRAFIISSIEYSFWNCASGLFTECLWFFQAICAKCSRLVPYFSMCSRPAPPNICAVMGAASMPNCSAMTITCFSFGFARSSHCIRGGVRRGVRTLGMESSEPFIIFSKPTARQQSEEPASMNCFIMSMALLPLAHALFTL